VTLADTDRARDLVRDGTPASVRDLIHAAVMLNNDVKSIASFDGGFDNVKGIERLSLD
jgi:predicted nucleic acid-binding protein